MGIGDVAHARIMVEANGDRNLRHDGVFVHLLFKRAGKFKMKAGFRLYLVLGIILLSLWVFCCWFVRLPPVLSKATSESVGCFDCWLHKHKAFSDSRLSGDPHSVTLNPLCLRYEISLSLPLNSLLKPRYSEVIHGVLHVKAWKKKRMSYKLQVHL